MATEKMVVVCSWCEEKRAHFRCKRCHLPFCEQACFDAARHVESRCGREKDEEDDTVGVRRGPYESEFHSLREGTKVVFGSVSGHVAFGYVVSPEGRRAKLKLFQEVDVDYPVPAGGVVTETARVIRPQWGVPVGDPVKVTISGKLPGGGSVHVMKYEDEYDPDRVYMYYREDY